MTTHDSVDVAAVTEQFPLIKDLQSLKELSWFNPAATAAPAAMSQTIARRGVRAT